MWHFPGSGSFQDVRPGFGIFQEVAFSWRWHFPGSDIPQDVGSLRTRPSSGCVLSQDVAVPSICAARRRKRSGIMIWHLPGCGLLQDVASSTIWQSPASGTFQDVAFSGRWCFPECVVLQDVVVFRIGSLLGFDSFKDLGVASMWPARRRKEICRRRGEILAVKKRSVAAGAKSCRPR